jgi:mannose-6-phosphate isomerase class I
MSGVDWRMLEASLRLALGSAGVAFFDTDAARLPVASIRARLGGGDAEFGRLYNGKLADFFDHEALAQVGRAAQQAVAGGAVAFVLGQGSALIELDGPLAWVELPKDRIRAAGTGALLGGVAYALDTALNSVDLPMLRAHKAALLPRMDLYVDFGEPSQPVFLDGDALRANLHTLAGRPFRARRVAYPSLWGGQYLKGTLKLGPESANVGWSYEFVAIESGVVFEDGGLRLEVPVDLLLAQESDRIQGSSMAARFGSDFPVRLNLTDTLDGGDLSCQVHPAPDYAAQLLGYPLVQDETYVVVRSEPDARIHLGLRADADVRAFRQAAERARDEGIPFEVHDYVDAWPAEVGAVFCIPRGTIHHIGKNALVLEIISSSVVCTFRLYDYLRHGADGSPRPVHIEQAFAVLDTQRRTDETRGVLLPEPQIVRQGPDWVEYAHTLPAPVHHRVHRADFSVAYPDDTRGLHFHLLHVLEGEQVALDWADGSHPLTALDTILVPAATGAYRLRSVTGERCRVVKAFVPYET